MSRTLLGISGGHIWQGMKSIPHVAFGKQPGGCGWPDENRRGWRYVFQRKIHVRVLSSRRPSSFLYHSANANRESYKTDFPENFAKYLQSIFSIWIPSWVTKLHRRMRGRSILQYRYADFTTHQYRRTLWNWHHAKHLAHTSSTPVQRLQRGSSTTGSQPSFS